uniref:Uncharacterized protein n=1 Tax=Cacopsylla melanoneura TaxID=428564 RepID=A0A8D8VWY4_9HEMI
MTQNQASRIVQQHRKEKVTKYFNYQLKLLNLVGLFRLPEDVPRGKWFHHRSVLYSIYLWFAFIYFGLFLVLCFACNVVYVRKDFTHSSFSMLENSCVIMIFIEIVSLNMRREDLFKLLQRMDKFDVTTKPNIFKNVRRFER